MAGVDAPHTGGGSGPASTGAILLLGLFGTQGPYRQVGGRDGVVGSLGFLLAGQVGWTRGWADNR
jgi:hypothetical protein